MWVDVVTIYSFLNKRLNEPLQAMKTYCWYPATQADSGRSVLSFFHAGVSLSCVHVRPTLAVLMASF